MRDYSAISTEGLVILYCHRFGKRRITNSDLEGKIKRFWQRYGVFRLSSNYSRAFRYIVEEKWIGRVGKREIQKKRNGRTITFLEYRLPRRARPSDIRPARHRSDLRRH